MTAAGDYFFGFRPKQPKAEVVEEERPICEGDRVRILPTFGSVGYRNSQAPAELRAALIGKTGRILEIGPMAHMRGDNRSYRVETDEGARWFLRRSELEVLP